MNQSVHAYREKRDYIRMRAETPVTLQHAQGEVSVRCLDLSSTGMQIEAACSLRMGDKVKVHIAAEHNPLKRLNAQAEVVRVSNLDNGRLALGLAVIAMS